MAERLIRRAPAKLNLVLEVTGRRDDGYHEVDTVMQELLLADDVEVTFGAREGVTVDGPFAVGAPEDASNLAWKAAERLAEVCSESTENLHILLTKRIPAAGGLGGGSSDAVAVLRLLQAAWGAADDHLLQVATGIGSDEAFFLHGGTARARGRGEMVTPLSPLKPHGVVLFVPGATIAHKTARMFAALDLLPPDPGGVAETFARRTPGAFASGDVYNTFERVAFDLFDGLHSLWAALEERTGQAIRLAGAGPTLFWIGPLDQAAVIADRASRLPCTVIQTATAGAR